MRLRYKVGVLMKILNWWASGLACSKFGWIKKLDTRKSTKEEIIEQVRSAILDMMDKVKFIDNDKKKHYYEEIKTGIKLQGVSTVSSIIPKDWLSAWGARKRLRH